MDIDLDLQSSFNPGVFFNKGVQASMVKTGKLVKHPVGIYFQNIAKDPITQLAAIPYKQAEQLGYFKVDFIHLSLLDSFKSKQQIRKLVKIPPNWKMLEDRNVVERLFHIHDHFDLIQRVKPQSIEELADCVALIRPGKYKLIPIYLKDKKLARTFLYIKKDQQYTFKKGHAISYAINIVLNLHLISSAT